MPTEVVKVKAEAKEIARVMENLLQATQGEEQGLSIMSAIGLAFVLQRPDMELVDLAKAIDHASNWIAFYLENLDGIPKEKIN